MKSLDESLLQTKIDSYKKTRRNRRHGLKTGLKTIDGYLQGLGGLVNIQGETSSCKSALALQIAHYNLRQGVPCVMLDKENGEGRVIDRMVCQANLTYFDKIHQASDSDIAGLLAPVEQLPLHLHIEEIPSTEAVAANVAECWERYRRPFLLLVDSVQAMDRLSEDQRVSLETWVYFLDRLKVEYAGRLTVMIVSEKNRTSYGQQGVGGGKGSNVLDYKPETVLDIKWNDTDDSFTLKVSKHRDGQRGASFDLEKHQVEAGNPRSFCFRLREPEEVP